MINNLSLNEEAVIYAVNWWSDQIFKPELQLKEKDRLGYNNKFSIIKDISNKLTFDSYTSLTIEAFETTLKSGLLNYRNNYIELNCDYNPCHFLADVMSNIDQLIYIPIKIFSVIDSNIFHYKNGYNDTWSKITF